MNITKDEEMAKIGKEPPEYNEAARSKEDVWLTAEEAAARLTQEYHSVGIEMNNHGTFLRGNNEHGAAIIRCRVFDGSEHPNARKGMVLDWRR